MTTWTARLTFAAAPPPDDEQWLTETLPQSAAAWVDKTTNTTHVLFTIHADEDRLQVLQRTLKTSAPLTALIDNLRTIEFTLNGPPQ